jgi:hypothetical protein
VKKLHTKIEFFMGYDPEPRCMDFVCGIGYIWKKKFFMEQKITFQYLSVEEK